MTGLERRVLEAVGHHPAVRSIRLAGSRADGRALPGSDWDFVLETHDFASLAGDLPLLCEPLDPIARQWDRLSDHECYMLILHGPAKVDLIFPAQPREHEPPWEPGAENLSAIDCHFWDWTLWLSGKQRSGKADVVAAELPKLYAHLLEPLGVRDSPATLSLAVVAYRAARHEAERRFAVEVPRTLEREVSATVER